MSYTHAVAAVTYRFDDLKTLLAKASPARSGDRLAGIAAATAEERVAAQMALADLPLKAFLGEPLVPYESDEVTRLIFDSHDPQSFRVISHFTVGELRDWLLSDGATSEALTNLVAAIIPEMAAAVSKIMRVQDLIAVARKIRVVTRFRNTIGLPGGCPPACSPITLPTTQRASQPASFQTDLCWVAAMPSSG